MKRFHIHTTLPAKHIELLKRQQEKLDASQQKVLELALESLESNPKPGMPLTPELELWMRIGTEPNAVTLLDKEVLQILLETADMDRLKAKMVRDRHIIYEIQYYLRKPLEECSLGEIVDGLVVTTRMAKWMDNIVCSDEGAFYSIIITHCTGLKASKLFMTGYGILFDAAGARYESHVSEKSIFIKVYK